MEGNGVILDTHTLLWIDRNDPSVGMQARQQVEAAWRSAWVVSADREILDWEGDLDRIDARV